MLEEKKSTKLLEEITNLFKSIEDLPDGDIKDVLKEMEDKVTKKEG